MRLRISIRGRVRWSVGPVLFLNDGLNRRKRPYSFYFCLTFSLVSSSSISHFHFHSLSPFLFLFRTLAAKIPSSTKLPWGWEVHILEDWRRSNGRDIAPRGASPSSLPIAKFA